MDDAAVQTISSTQWARVSYERGFDIVEIEGWFYSDGPWLVVYGNPDLPIDQQRRTAVLQTRVIELDVSAGI